MSISIYLLTTSHTHLLLTTPTSHTHIFHPLSKIVIHTSVQYGCAEVWMTILESGWNLWVWLVGVVSRRWVWLVVRRYIDILTILEPGKWPCNSHSLQSWMTCCTTYIDPERGNRRRATVPLAMRPKLMEQTHSGPYGGHFSGQRMFNAMVTSWWWEGQGCSATWLTMQWPALNMP